MKRALYYLYERRLLRDLRCRALPQHLGLIQDGHRRYSREAGLTDLTEGYWLGARKTEEVLGWCLELGIPMVTLWWLSIENLLREPDDLASVLKVIEAKMGEWVAGGLAMRSGIRTCPIGRLELLPASTLHALRLAETATRHHDRMLLNVGVGYSGRQEIVDAVKGYLEDSFARDIAPVEIVGALTPETVEKYLYTCGWPDPDLIVRTSGEIRLSGFMLWQSAYSEYYFCDAYWPAFRKIDFLRAVRALQQRQRRFGR
jgi:short-chain Z-isoprenyl diphosphate synthase